MEPYVTYTPHLLVVAASRSITLKFLARQTIEKQWRYCRGIASKSSLFFLFSLFPLDSMSLLQFETRGIKWRDGKVAKSHVFNMEMNLEAGNFLQREMQRSEAKNIPMRRTRRRVRFNKPNKTIGPNFVYFTVPYIFFPHLPVLNPTSPLIPQSEYIRASH